MSHKKILVALFIEFYGSVAQANSQTSQLNLPAIASKDTRMEISLTHPGLQPVNSNKAKNPTHTLAASISNPEFNTTYQLKARKLYGSMAQEVGTDINLAINGQQLSAKHSLILEQATLYYLSYEASDNRPDQIGDAAYEFIVHWRR